MGRKAGAETYKNAALLGSGCLRIALFMLHGQADVMGCADNKHSSQGTEGLLLESTCLGRYSQRLVYLSSSVILSSELRALGLETGINSLNHSAGNPFCFAQCKLRIETRSFQIHR